MIFYVEILLSSFLLFLETAIFPFSFASMLGELDSLFGVVLVDLICVIILYIILVFPGEDALDLEALTNFDFVSFF